MKIKRILLTSDLSPESQRAFAPAADLARQHGAALTLVHVVEPLPPQAEGGFVPVPLDYNDLNRRVEVAQTELEKAVESFGKDLDVELEVLSGERVAPAVVRHAKQCGADLIALSTHGRTGFRRLVLGSVAEDIVRHSEVPVLCFPMPKK